MDIYGYPPYQFSQSDELAKQMAQQALAAPIPNHVPEPHIMPAPSGSPWTGQSLSWSMSSPPQLVQFTAPPQEVKLGTVAHCKRKSLDVEPAIPPKQFITEEKMAAHLSGLHISSDYTSHSLASENVMEVAMEGSSTHNISEKLKGHTIVLSDAVKKLQEEPLIPVALIERFQKPQMSLVVWQPRENIIEKIKEEKIESDEESPKKRNGVLVLDQTRMDMEI